MIVVVKKRRMPERESSVSHDEEQSLLSPDNMIDETHSPDNMIDETDFCTMNAGDEEDTSFI